MKFSAFEKQMAKGQFDQNKRIDFYNQLIALVGTGMSVTEAIQMAWVVASFEGKKPKRAIAVVLHEILLVRKNGGSLAQALKPWVPSEDVMIFEAIENSDEFVENLQDYIELLDKKRKIRSTIIGGMAYPVLLLTSVYGIVTYFGTSVLPKISAIVPVDEWTGPAAVLRTMKIFADEWAIPTAFFILIAITVIVFSLSRWTGAGRVIADRFPIYSTYRMYTGISFLMSMAALIRGGMPPKSALEQLRPSANAYVGKRITQVRNAMLNGYNFGAALYRGGQGWPDQEMNLSIKVFAETQDLSAQLTKLSKTWVDQSQQRIERGMGTVRIIAMFAVFGVVMLMIGGIYSLQDQIAQSVQKVR